MFVSKENNFGVENKYWFIENLSSEEWNHNSYLPINSNVVLFNGSLEDGYLDLFDAYHPFSGSELRSQLWGVWSCDDGEVMIPRDRWHLRRDLTGVVFRTAANEDPPFVKTISDSGDDTMHPPGYVRSSSESLKKIFLGPSLYGDIWSSLQSITNFSYSMVYSVDGSWGSLNDDGSWNGVVGMMERDEVDVGVTSLFATRQRKNAVDFSPTLDYAE